MGQFPSKRDIENASSLDCCIRCGSTHITRRIRGEETMRKRDRIGLSFVVTKCKDCKYGVANPIREEIERTE